MRQPLATLALCVAASTAVHAQTVQEIWPEVDVLWQQAAHQRNLLELSSSAEQEGKSREGTVGVYQDYLQLPGAFYRGGFRYTFSTADASYRELRMLAEANVTAYQGYRLRLINRTRGELRDVNNEISWRLRDRIHLQRYAVDDAPPAWAPYGTFEAYYDSRYSTIARLGARGGTEARINRTISVDVYVARQDNSRGSPPAVEALGVTVKLTYR